MLTKLKEEDLASDLPAAPHVAAIQRFRELGAPAASIAESNIRSEARTHSRPQAARQAGSVNDARRMQIQPDQCAHVSALLQVLPQPFDVVAAVDRWGMAGKEDSVRASRKQPPHLHCKRRYVELPAGIGTSYGQL